MRILIRTKEQIRVCGGNYVRRNFVFSANIDDNRNKNMGMVCYRVPCLSFFYEIMGGLNHVRRIFIFSSNACN